MVRCSRHADVPLRTAGPRAHLLHEDPRACLPRLSHAGLGAFPTHRLHAVQLLAHHDAWVAKSREVLSVHLHFRLLQMWPLRHWPGCWLHHAHDQGEENRHEQGKFSSWPSLSLSGLSDRIGFDSI